MLEVDLEFVRFPIEVSLGTGLRKRIESLVLERVNTSISVLDRYGRSLSVRRSIDIERIQTPITSRRSYDRSSNIAQWDRTGYNQNANNYFPKLDVAGSIPVARSNSIFQSAEVSLHYFIKPAMIKVSVS